MNDRQGGLPEIAIIERRALADSIYSKIWILIPLDSFMIETILIDSKGLLVRGNSGSIFTYKYTTFIT